MWASHPQTQYPSPGPKPDEETERNAEPEWNPGLFSKKKFRSFIPPRGTFFPELRTLVVHGILLAGLVDPLL